MNEQQLIERVRELFPRAAAQLNAPFTADAELVRLGGETWAVTTDEFSAEEDGFRHDDAAVLGWNLGVATLSDLFACGAAPRFFLQAMVAPAAASEDFVLGLARGLSRALSEAGCFLLGGDMGMGESWRFTGVALGPVRREPPLTRWFEGEDVSLWVSGPLGDANAALLAGTDTPVFELRLAAAELAAEHGRGCIDTSGGLLDALHMLGRANPHCRIELDLASVPLAPGVREVSRQAAMPAAGALVGGAGEYELLWGVPDSVGDQTVRALLDCGAVRLGEARHRGTPGLFVRTATGTRLAPPCPDPRGFTRREDYIAAVVRAGLELGD